MDLAQVNIATLRAPVEHPDIADFVAELDRINALGDAAPGWVWRYLDDCRESDVVSPWGREVIMNLTIWNSLEALKAFAFNGEHMALMRRRREWFHPMKNYSALWWVGPEERPSADEAKQRLDHLAAHGPTDYAFTFGTARNFPAGEPLPHPGNSESSPAKHTVRTLDVR